MNTKSFFLAFCLSSILLSVNVFAQNQNESFSSDDMSRRSGFKHAINICPIAPIFGVYALNYEYLFSPKNGMLVRVEYEDVPKSYTEANIETSGIAFSINYRRHFSNEMNSIFVGAFARYRNYDGFGEIESEKFDFTLPSVTFGLNAGKRWVWNSGFNLTFSIGYGYQEEFREVSPTNPLNESLLDQLEEEYDFMTPMYAELSAGYAF
jgi:hypothetical protein